ncbi:MAG: hypothetical protein EXR62_17575 [Chloroflexi bacterium]|nr:hypothetical protein [Chloroflexota bacterium]
MQALGVIAGIGQIVVMDRVGLVRYPTPPPPQTIYIPTTESLPLGFQSSISPSFYRLGLQDGKIVLLYADAHAGKLSDKALRATLTEVTHLAGQTPALPAGGLILAAGPQSIGETLESFKDPLDETSGELQPPTAKTDRARSTLNRIIPFPMPRQVPMDDFSDREIEVGAAADAAMFTGESDSAALQKAEEMEDFHFGPTSSVTGPAIRNAGDSFEDYRPSANSYALITGIDLAKSRKRIGWPFSINLSRLSRGGASTILKFGSGLSALSRSMAGILVILLRRILPEPASGAQNQPQARHRIIFRTVATAIPLFLIVLTLGAYWEVRGSQQARAAAAFEEAQNRYQNSLNSQQDPVAARAIVNEAQIAVDQVLALQPAHKDAQALKIQIMRQMDSINGVVRLNDISLLADLKEQGSLGGQLQIQGNYLYILDKGTGRVLRYSLASNRMGLSDPSASIIVSRGESIGANRIGDLIDMALYHGPNIAPTDIDMILDSNGILLRSNPTLPAIELVNLPGTQIWKHPVAISSFGGNLYILDTAANQIFRYTASTQGYTQKPESWLQPDPKVDLTTGVDMAIDGQIYVLRSDSTILKFSQGKLVDFSLSGLDAPLRNPTALYTTPETHSIYVVDTGNERIVQFGKTGKFERQFRPKTGSDLAIAKFGKLQDLVVDESAQHLYLVRGNQILAATIPTLTP